MKDDKGRKNKHESKNNFSRTPCIDRTRSNGACSNSKQDQATSAPNDTGKQAAAPAPVTLKGMLFGDQPKDMQVVLDEFEKRTKDNLNTKLNIQWNPAADHKQKTKLMMAAGEEMDFVFDADFLT